MKQKYILLILLSIIAITHISCEKVDPDDPSKSESSSIISQFVYDGMSTYYFWADEMKKKKPTKNDTDPVKYFEKILNNTDTENGWSWMTDDVYELLAGFSGESLSFGYDLGFINIDGAIYAFIKYVHTNTPAEKAGLERLDLIGKLNGEPITTEQRDGKTYVSSKSVSLLYGNKSVDFTVYKINGDQIAVKKEKIPIAPDGSKKDPVLYHNIYTIGSNKIGYLFYTNFYANFNHRLYEVFQNFKQEGITDLVLDLRYNTGGAVSAAIYLASLIAPKNVVENKSPFVTMQYNDMLNSLFDKWYDEAKPADKYKYDRKDYLGTYDTKDENPLNANLNLNRVYIIATDDSYSASELILFCLRPYMDVIHVGTETGGKYTASWTLHGYDEDLGVPIYDAKKLSTENKNILKNWAMQPIVAMYARINANGKVENFSNPGHLVPDHKMEEGFGKLRQWAPTIGDTKDALLGQALYLISKDNSYRPVNPRSAQAIRQEMIHSRDMAKPVIIEHRLTEEDFQKLRESQH